MESVSTCFDRWRFNNENYGESSQSFFSFTTEGNSDHSSAFVMNLKATIMEGAVSNALPCRLSDVNEYFDSYLGYLCTSKDYWNNKGNIILWPGSGGEANFYNLSKQEGETRVEYDEVSVFGNHSCWSRSPVGIVLLSSEATLEQLDYSLCFPFCYYYNCSYENTTGVFAHRSINSDPCRLLFVSEKSQKQLLVSVHCHLYHNYHPRHRQMFSLSIPHEHKYLGNPLSTPSSQFHTGCNVFHKMSLPHSSEPCFIQRLLYMYSIRIDCECENEFVPFYIQTQPVGFSCRFCEKEKNAFQMEIISKNRAINSNHAFTRSPEQTKFIESNSVPHFTTIVRDEGSKEKCSQEKYCHNEQSSHSNSLNQSSPPARKSHRVKTYNLPKSFVSTSPSSPAYSPLSSTSSAPSSSKSPLCSYFLGVFILFVLTLLSNPSPTTAKKGLVLHAFMPLQFFEQQEYDREFSNTLLNFLRDKRNRPLRFKTQFSVRQNITHIKHDKPTEILDAFCTNVLNGKTTAIVNFNNPLGMRKRPSSNRYITNLVQHWGIPIISWDSEYSGTPQAEYEYRTLQLAPTVSHQVRAMISLLDRYNWTHFSIVTSRVAGDMEFVSTLEKFVDISQKLPRSNNGVKRKRLEILSKVHIHDKEKSKEKLSKFVGSETRVFLLHCSSYSSYDIMEAATALELTGADYVWILTRSCIPHAKRAPRSFPVGLLGISFDYGKEAMKSVLRVAAKVWLTALVDMIRAIPNVADMDIPPQLSCKSTEKQFWQYGRVLYDYMLNVTIRDEPNVVFNRNGTLRFTEMSIINLQWIDGRKNSKHWLEVGRWKRYGLKMKDITWPGETPNAPTGRPKKAFVRINTLYETPYVIYRNLTKTGGCPENSLPCQIYARDGQKNIIRNGTIKKCCVGLSVDLLKILKEELNFDAELKEVRDGQWGGTDADGNWNGLVKALMEDECDMVITSLKINPDRAGAVQFSVPYLETGIKIIVALRDGAISPTAFLEPYDYASWSLILIFSVHATGSSILIFEWLSPKGLNRGLTPMRDHKFSLFRSFWLIWAMLFSTSVQTDSPRGIASRFLANIWALFALVFLASYTANLAAFMITKEEFYDLSGIKDYRLQNPYVMNPPFKYATTAYGSTEAMLKSNHMKMYKYMKKLNSPDVEAGIKDLKAGKIHAFIYDSSVLEYIASRDPNCRLVTVGNRYAETGYGIGFPPEPNNPWIDKVNKVILRLQENGELDRLQKFWLAGACDTKKEKGVSNRTLGILNFTSAFILLGTGILLGLMLLVIEHIYFKFGRKQLRQIDKCGCCALVSLSMGRSLRMKDTVTQAMSLVAKNRCKDPVCETHMWKLKHKLDMALLKIENLEVQLSISEDDGVDTMPKSITMESTSLYDRSQPNHRPNYGVVNQQPRPQQHPLLHQQHQQAQITHHQQLPPSSSHGLHNNIGNHNNSHRRHPAAPHFTTPNSKHNPSLFEVHSIPEVMYTKDQNGDSCHIRTGITEEQFSDNPAALLETSAKPENNIIGNKYVELPPSYSDCSADYFHEEDGQYAPFNALDDIDSECCSTHSTATTSLGANATGKISPWPGLKRSPSYTSAVGGSFGSDIDNKSPGVNKSRKYDGKTYVGVSGLGV